MRIMIKDENDMDNAPKTINEELENLDNIQEELNDIEIDPIQQEEQHSEQGSTRVFHDPFVDEASAMQNDEEGEPRDDEASDDVDDDTSENDEFVSRDEYDALLDRYNRMMHDWDSYRTRTTADIEHAKDTANANLVEALLPTLDNFDRAIQHAQSVESEETSGIISGFQAIQRSMISALEREGVVMLSPLGEPFDMNKHQAVERVETSEVPSDTVVKVLQPGYELRGKLIRPAIVSVSAQ